MYKDLKPCGAHRDCLTSLLIFISLAAFFILLLLPLSADLQSERNGFKSLKLLNGKPWVLACLSLVLMYKVEMTGCYPVRLLRHEQSQSAQRFFAQFLEESKHLLICFFSLWEREHIMAEGTWQSEPVYFMAWK